MTRPITTSDCNEPEQPGSVAATGSAPRCEFLVAFKQCWEFATQRRHTVIKTTLKGQPYEWSPPDEFYCDRHAVWASKWGGEMFPLASNELR